MSNPFLPSSRIEDERLGRHPQSGAGEIPDLWEARERAVRKKLQAYEREEASEFHRDQASVECKEAVCVADAAFDAVEAIEDEIMAAPVRTLADLAMKARIVDDGFEPDADRVARLCSDILKLAGFGGTEGKDYR